ncbi:hypothetical protein RIR_jg9714.t1 [Rhizophagus irregularis DAOM 181602=DAOM 197198]|nr:hypothetical protein RIR_jg9714.t1 [Rhizophagus irregularis DAOM 181602=DAOM 197198]
MKAYNNFQNESIYPDYELAKVPNGQRKERIKLMQEQLHKLHEILFPDYTSIWKMNPAQNNWRAWNITKKKYGTEHGYEHIIKYHLYAAQEENLLKWLRTKLDDRPLNEINIKIPTMDLIGNNVSIEVNFYTVIIDTSRTRLVKEARSSKKTEAPVFFIPQSKTEGQPICSTNPRNSKRQWAFHLLMATFCSS